MSKSSVFSLEQFYRKQINGTTSTLNDVFVFKDIANPAGTDYGYTGGGYTMIPVARQSTMDRLDYSSDTSTMSVRGSLNNSIQSVSSTSSQSFGYFAGGYYPSSFSTIDRVDFANDSPTATPKGNLSVGRSYAVPAGNKDFGYAAGGFAPSTTSSIDRIDYSSDTSTASPKGNLADAGVFHQAGTGNQSFGYFAGGSYNSDGTTVQRIQYSNDTAAATPKGPLATAISRTASTGTGDFGYVGSGIEFISMRTIVQRIDYSSDTSTTSPKGPVTLAKFKHSAFSSTTHGYFTGGTSPAENTGTGWTTTDRIDYSNDTATALVKGPLSQGRQFTTSTSSRDNGNPSTVLNPAVPATRSESYPNPAAGPAFGYFGGGDATLSTIDRVDYSNDTAVAAAKGPLADARYALAGTSSKDYGYFGGGYSPAGGGTRWSRIDRIDYASDGSTALVKGNMTSGRSSVYGTGNLSYGYFGGGATDIYAAMTNIDRVDYANDTPTASPKGPLSVQRGRSCALGTLSYGYFTGGNDNTPGYPVISSVDRLDYASDSSTTVLKGNLTIARKSIGGAGNSSYGYLSGGRVDSPSLAYFSTIDRIDYSSDTSTASPKGSLSAATSYRTGTGDASYGYMGGGQIVSPSSPYTKTSSVERIDYSNDTAIASPKGPLTVIQYGAGGASALDNAKPNPTNKTVDKGADGFEVPVPPTETFGPAYGYIPHGWPVNTRIQRIDFDNDTATTVNKGNLAQKAGYSAGMSNTTHGYVTGGLNPAEQTTVQRIDYASDTSTAATKGPINYPTRNSAGNMGNTTHGYIASGSGGSSRVDRITYASDTSTATSRAALATAIPGGWSVSGISDASYGYVVGGGYGGSTYIQRIDFSNDNATPSPKSNLTTARAEHGTNGNTSYAWITGGPQPGKSSVERIDYSNDTSSPSPRGNITAARYNFGGTGNPNYGYFAGGGPGARTDVDRIDYANDSATAVLKGPLNQFTSAYDGLSSRNRGQSISSPNPPSYTPRIRWVDSASEGTPITQGPAHGYFAGGAYPGVSAEKSTIDRIDFDNDTATASPKGNLASATKRNDAVMNMTHGYVTGNMPSEPSRVQRIDYANDTATASIRGPLSASTQYMMDVTNINFGYVIGGGGPAGQRSKIDRIDFSNDTATASNIASLPANRWSGTGIGNKDFGYICGGKTPSIISNIDRLDYSSDTTTVAPKGPLSATRRYNSATSNNDFGYVGGGAGNNSDSSVDRVDFSNDTATASTKGPLTTTGNYRTATGNSNFGYFAGGQGSSFNLRSTIDRIDYSNDTATASPKGALTVAKNKAAGISARESGLPIPQPTIAAPVQRPFPFPEQLPAPAPAHGYYVSGRENGAPSPATTKIDRIDFSNDTATTVLKGNMHTGRNRHTSLANQTHGYTGGGSNPAEASPAYLSSIERMTFANDTATSVDKSTFRAAFTKAPSPGQGANAAVSIGNLSYGYWQGAGTTYVDRLDYSNDTAQAAATTYSTISTNYRAAVSSLSYGYFTGGWVNQSVVDRLDYASDSTTMSPKGNLAAAVSHNFGVGNGNYGYIVAGRNTGSPSDRSDVQRIDFADDTATATPKGPLAGTTYNGAGTGDASYGYVVQAQVNAPSFGYYTTIFRIDYSNDTATAAARGTFSWPGSQMKGLSGRAYGLPN
mgnify:CR=1 FL=1